MKERVIDPENKLKKDLKKAIEHRRYYESLDFKLAHIFLWISILSSFSASIIIASNITLKTIDCHILTAIIAGVPGLVIIIDKSFDFKKRAIWGSLYRIELQELDDMVNFKKIELFEAAIKFREIERRNEMEYAKIGFFAKKHIDNKKHIDDKKI